MSRGIRVTMDPAALKRVRAARAAEDAALSALFGRVAALDAAKTRRTNALAALDADVHNAEAVLADARGALVAATGLQRAAVILDLTPTTLRKLLPATPAGSRR